MIKKANSIKLFKRFSQITGVPLEKLYPLDSGRNPIQGRYKHETHTFVSAGDSKKISSAVRDHEIRHGLQALANPALDRQITRLDSRWQNLVNRSYYPEKIRIKLQRLREEFRLLNRNWGEPINIFNEESSESAAKRDAYYHPDGEGIKTKIKRFSNVKSVFRKHGYDGILLLWVAPPKTLDAIDVPEWEKQMVAKGYLEPKGGLTKKGLQYWRQFLQPASVWRQLTAMEEERKKRGLSPEQLTSTKPVIKKR